MTIPRIEIYLESKGSKSHLNIALHTVPNRGPLPIEVDLATLEQDGFELSAKKLGESLLGSLSRWHAAEFAPVLGPGSKDRISDMSLVRTLVGDSLARRTREHIPTIELLLQNATTGKDACAAFLTGEWPQFKQEFERF